MKRKPNLNLSIMLGPPKISNYVEMICELTPWCLTETQKPPFLGWWRTWGNDTVQRRWWNGYVWSIPSGIGVQDVLVAETPTTKNSGEVIWCGLGRPHPAGYTEYSLVKSPRTVIWSGTHKRE